MTDAVVVGAGVIGLTTAVCLAEAGLDVAIWAERGPLQSTSAAASGLWVPGYTSDRELRWSLVGLTEFTALLDDDHTGVRLARGLGVTDLFDAPQEFHDHLPELELVDQAELRGRFPLGWWSTVPLIDMPRYLAYLSRRFHEAGGRLVQRHVDDLSACLEAAPLVVNCTGVGAKHLADDDEVFPVRGQHVVVRNPGIDHWYMEGVESPFWTGFFPHGNKVLLAGVSQHHNWNLLPDPADAASILERCAAAEPGCATPKSWDTGSACVRPGTRRGSKSSTGPPAGSCTATGTAVSASASPGGPRGRSSPSARACRRRCRPDLVTVCATMTRSGARG